MFLVNPVVPDVKNVMFCPAPLVVKVEEAGFMEKFPFTYCGKKLNFPVKFVASKSITTEITLATVLCIQSIVSDPYIS